MQITTGCMSTIDVPSGTVLTKTEPTVQLASEISNWLEERTLTQPQPEEVLTWHHRWSRAGVALRSAEHLATLVSQLTDGAYGGVEGPREGRWVQIMRVEQHWIVEVRHESEDYPKRVYRETEGPWPGKHRPGGELWNVEEFRSLKVADVAWSWMRRGFLPEGMACTSDFRH